MIQKILGTAGSRILHALLNFVVLMIITQNLGDEGTGLLGLIVLNVSVIMLLAEFIGGSSLIYFASRKNIYSLLITSWFWLLLSVLFFSGLEFVLRFFPSMHAGAIPEGYWPYILGLAIVMSLNYINYNLLIGKEMIKEYNIVFSIHIILLVSVLAFLIEVVGYEDIKAFIFAEYIAFGICYLISWYYLYPLLKDRQNPDLFPLIREIISYGSFGQGANLITMINKRLSFYVINGSLGLGPLGIYNAGVQITEGLRLIGTSISTVQFARISNQKDPEYAKRLSIQLLKFTVAITAFGVNSDKSDPLFIV
ncbi:MAG: oligosaccharide flippase family protein [Bacteroidales bacterium]|nr:oligosaccharide flippase family protein [Bacteroidales bacterium]